MISKQKIKISKLLFILLNEVELILSNPWFPKEQTEIIKTKILNTIWCSIYWIWKRWILEKYYGTPNTMENFLLIITNKNKFRKKKQEKVYGIDITLFLFILCCFLKGELKPGLVCFFIWFHPLFEGLK